MKETQTARALTKIIGSAGHDLADFIKWPDSESTKESMESTLKSLHKSFREGSYPMVFRYLVMLHIAHDMYAVVRLRDFEKDGLKGLKQAWMRLGEMIE